MIDMDELIRLRIYERLGDTWAWVAPEQRGSWLLRLELLRLIRRFLRGLSMMIRHPSRLLRCLRLPPPHLELCPKGWRGLRRRLQICERLGDTWAWVAPGQRGSWLLRLELLRLIRRFLRGLSIMIQPNRQGASMPSVAAPAPMTS
ncbi:hypothetical protein Tco_1047674 [Tanacetum coccineum]